MRITKFLLLLVFISFTSFHSPEGLPDCYKNFVGTDVFMGRDLYKVTSTGFITQYYKTPKGKVSVGILDQYSITYADPSGHSIADLIIQLSDSKKFKSSYLDYYKTVVEHMETQYGVAMPMIELHKNGYVLYAFLPQAVEGRIKPVRLVLFTTDKLCVSFSFDAWGPASKYFKDQDDFVDKIDHFIDMYTKHIRECEE